MATPEQAAEAMIANLKEKTGRTLDQWIAVVRTSELARHGEIVKMLKADHGMSHGYANLVAHKALASDAGSALDADLVTAQYAGSKVGLRPIYDRVIKAVRAFGDDVEIAPKKSYVSLRRRKQFGLIQPSTKTRVDIGISLRDQPPSGRLEASGSFNSMVTHRVRIEDPASVDAELTGWLRTAYDES